MNRLLWLLQVVFGLYFIAVGVIHFVVPEGLPSTLEWMYDLSENLHVVAGTAEILGGLALILPGLVGRYTGLTPLAATGLALIMLGAIVFHAGRGEIPQIGINVVNAAVFAFIAYGRWRLSPLPSRTSVQTH